MATNPKVFDVAKPDDTTPGSTSRPIIVNHAPALEDPMMAKTSSEQSGDAKKTAPADAELPPRDGKAPEATAASVSTLSSKSRVTLSPLTGNEAATPKEPQEPKTEEAPADETSDAAMVSAVAEQSGANKKEKQTKEDLAKQEAIQKLIESKQYYVPIKDAKQTRGVKRFLGILFVVLLLGLIAADLAVDAGIIKTNIKPVVDLIKN